MTGQTIDRAAAARQRARYLLVVGLLLMALQFVLWLYFRWALFTIIGAHWWLFAEAAERYGWARGYEARGKETSQP